MSLNVITVDELKVRHESDDSLELIDVRTPGEYQMIHVEFAENHPLDKLNVKTINESRANPDQPLYVICKMGGRSAKACQQFVDAGITNVVNVEGGTDAWVKAGLHVQRSGKKVIALDRQVRITAGSLVLAGVLMAATVELARIGLVIAGVIGGGLVFSGLTDTCGMGTVLSKMPWNK